MDAMRKAMLSGLGALSLTKEKAEEIIDDLVIRGEMSEKDRTAMVEQLLKGVQMQKEELQGKVTSSVRKAMTDIGLPTQKDLKSVLRRLDAIEKAISTTNRDTQGTSK